MLRFVVCLWWGLRCYAVFCADADVCVYCVVDCVCLAGFDSGWVVCSSVVLLCGFVCFDTFGFWWLAMVLFG